MSKARSASVLRSLLPLHRLYAGLGATALLTAALIALAAFFVHDARWAQAQGGEPPAVTNLRCKVDTNRVLFRWDAPEWSGGETSAYDFQLSLPDGRSESRPARWRPAAAPDRRVPGG